MEGLTSSEMCSAVKPGGILEVQESKVTAVADDDTIKGSKMEEMYAVRSGFEECAPENSGLTPAA
jgi:F0F1-type ATP synthase epsilon subunit